MLRRLQWNFCKSISLLIFNIAWDIGKSNEYTDRLETEHIGNMDQYRVNREIPLPYAFGFEFQEELSEKLWFSNGSGILSPQ